MSPKKIIQTPYKTANQFLQPHAKETDEEKPNNILFKKSKDVDNLILSFLDLKDLAKMQGV